MLTSFEVHHWLLESLFYSNIEKFVLVLEQNRNVHVTKKTLKISHSKFTMKSLLIRNFHLVLNKFKIFYESINKKYIRLGCNLKTVTEKNWCFKADERWKCNNFSKNSQNVTLASTFCHIIPIDFVIVLLVSK